VAFPPRALGARGQAPRETPGGFSLRHAPLTAGVPEVFSFPGGIHGPGVARITARNKIRGKPACPAAPASTLVNRPWRRVTGLMAPGRTGPRNGPVSRLAHPARKVVPMRKLCRAGGVAAGALALALTAGAFAFIPAAAAAPADTAPPPLTSIQPGQPMQGGGTRPAAPTFATNAIKTTSSSNWAGYVAVRSGVSFRFVSAHFYVPYLNCAGVTKGNPTYSSHWVGLDGFLSGSNTVEQTGILAACYPDQNGVITPTYNAWYEKYPNPPVYSRITIRPGDAITASVYFSSKTRTFTFTLADGTNGQHFSVAGKCPVGSTCARSSAEVISEAPSNGTNVLPLADYQAASYARTALTDSTGTRKGGLLSTYWDDYRISQLSDGTNLDAAGGTIPQGTPIALPTTLVSGAIFDAYWQPGT
jgi:hypothetical protein